MKLNHIKKYAKWNLGLHLCGLLFLIFVFTLLLIITPRGTRNLGAGILMMLIVTLTGTAIGSISFVFNLSYGILLSSNFKRVHPLLTTAGCFYTLATVLFWFAFFIKWPFLSLVGIYSLQFIADIIVLTNPLKFWPNDTIDLVKSDKLE